MSEHEKEASKLVAYLSVERAREYLALREKSALARIDKALRQEKGGKE
jgi:hypothetical protein